MNTLRAFCLILKNSSLFKKFYGPKLAFEGAYKIILKDNSYI